MITAEEVEYIAGLARLELNTEEKKKFQKDLGAILEFVEKLKKLNVEGVEPTTAGAEVVNMMRADESRFSHDPEMINKMLEQFPDRKGDFLKVKNILSRFLFTKIEDPRFLNSDKMSEEKSGKKN